ncbi:MAG: recombination protein RecR [Gammaproteobacteria bacterium]|nr:MAG: recombination protein RecR [Gammaproteobacteria bacterium]
MGFSPRLEQLFAALRCLPGVGPKTSQRMAFHLLSRDRDGGRRLVEALAAALDGIGECRRCRMLAEAEVCGICADPARDDGLLCVVESPADVLAVEESGAYRGRYFVLLGRLSPLDGIGPDELGLPLLQQRLRDDGIKEVMLATSATVEGEATAAYIGSLAERCGLVATRIAHGVPIGGELEFVDSNTLFRAIAARRPLAGESG